MIDCQFLQNQQAIKSLVPPLSIRKKDDFGVSSEEEENEHYCTSSFNCKNTLPVISTVT